jgi:hypothetical protein
MRWDWWIWCRACGNWEKGDTTNFRFWGCGKCNSHNIKGGISYTSWDPYEEEIVRED